MEGGLTSNFLMTLTVVIPDAEKERSKLESKKQKNNYQALSQMSKWVPKLLDIKADFDSITEFLDDGDKLVKMNFTCSIFADTRQELDSTCSGIKSYWDGFDFRFLKDSFFALPLFLNQLPFNTEHKIMNKTFRYRTMTTRQVAHFAPIVSEWRSFSRPALMFNTRLGQPIFVDLFDSSTSYSACIIAESGSGKSFLTNYLATSYMGMENAEGVAARVWIIDSGYSYQRLNKMLKGSYIDYDNKDLKMNPFEFISDFSDSSDMLLRMIFKAQK
jgi:conjugal transfer ATP-binding protein TraC